jgi:hypothetical protein
MTCRSFLDRKVYQRCVFKREGEWLAAQSIPDGGNVVVLEETDGCDAGGSGFEAGMSIG